jgi:DNA-binding transcriptional MerR regulator
VGGYTLGDVARICRVPRRRLRYWQRTKLLEPRWRGRAGFEFRDLVTVRRLVELLEQGVPLRRIRTSVASLRARLPEIARPLEALRVAPAGAGCVVARHEGVLIDPDGQLVLEIGGPQETGVAPLHTLPAESEPELRARRRAEAETWFEQGCRLDTDRANWGEAIAAYERAVSIDPDFADAHCNLGTVFYNQDRKALARACFERALELESCHLEAHLNLAALFEEAGRLESALSHYKRALDVEPLGADTHVSLALLYEKLALPGRARVHWRRYLQLDPEGSWADVARRHLGS